MIEVPCVSCGSQRHTPYATENGFQLVKCAACGLLYVNPRPGEKEIAESVKIGAHPGEGTLYSTGRYMPAKVAIFSKVLQDLFGAELRKMEGSWLDIGCGHGEFLVALKSLSGSGVSARGIEPNEHKAAAARKRGLDVSYFDLASHDRQYDHISFLNVYSHLTNPHEFLQLVRKRLKPKGEMLLQTGDTAHLPKEQHPQPFLLPDHLSFASQEILANMLKKNGFEIVTINKYPALQLQFMRQVLLKEAVKWVLPNKRSQLGYFYSMFRVRKHRTDMWIRARAA